ncbi:MAG TPA: hypothetical protein VE074_13665, partial [Jatrophihabitantaceae bacterium]|nr:hypothetical protein [Jatrophihabitantaceae bacterium]
DLRMILEQRWTTVPSDQFAREAKVVGDPERFAAAETSPSEGVVRPASGSGPDLLELLEDQRSADPDDPLWSGVRQMRADGQEVRIEFAERVTPQLLPVVDSSVQVSCHLHHDPTKS